MSFWALRAFFLLVCAGAGWQASRLIELEDPAWGLIGGMAMFTIVLALEALFSGKESIANLTAIVFGVAVGILIGNLAFYITMLILPLEVADDARYSTAVRIILTVPLCYLTTMIVVRTRDRFRFVIPYVEFKKEQKGPRALLLDSSVLIDGRIAALAKAGLFETKLFVPDFVLEELQKVADSADRLRRVRGRRGLDLVNQLLGSPGLDLSVYQTEERGEGETDARLVQLAREMDAHICTTDFNLTKVARAQGVAVLNLNEIASALRASFLRGETLAVQLVKPGEEENQAVGFLDDGTMVVVENAADRIGSEAQVEVLRVLQKASGRLIFGRLAT